MLGKVEICGVNTAKLPTLKSDEMTELLRRSHAGDECARETLIQGNLRLVLSVIQRFASRGENADDLFQVGCVGLIKAIDNFDVSQNVRFSTYGVPMIIGEIRRYLRDNSAIRVSRSMRDTAYRVLQAREKLQRENQREPTVEQIAKELDLPREEVVFAMDAVVDPVSLFDPVYSDGGDTVCVMDQVRDTRNTDESWLDRIALREAVDKLSACPDGYYDIIFMDIQMPRMNGYDATRAIRAMNRSYCRQVPIVAMTANAFAEDVQAAKTVGMNEHIAKPLDLRTLARTLEKWLR